MRIYVFWALLMILSSAFAVEEASITPESPKQDASTPSKAVTAEEGKTTAPASTETAENTDDKTTPKSTPPDGDKKEKVLKSIHQMTVEEIAELMNFVSTMEEEYGLSGPTLTIEEALQEKIAHTIDKMSPKEIAELMNFITAMEERIGATDGKDTVEEMVVSESIPKVVMDTLKRVIKVGADELTVTPAPLPGLYEAVFKTEVIYVSADGRYIMVGDIREIDTGKNLTDEKRAQLRAKIMNAADESEMIVFAPEKETKYTVNVFTDVDCPYCAKFHREVSDLNKAGVKVRYLAFPRAGKGSKTYNTMVSVWCAKDKQKALTNAKARREIESATCSNPIDKQYKLGKEVGITGTPAMVLPDGELVPGYLPADRIVAYFEQKEKDNKKDEAKK